MVFKTYLAPPPPAVFKHFLIPGQNTAYLSELVTAYAQEGKKQVLGSQRDWSITLSLVKLALILSQGEVHMTEVII